MTLNDIRVLKEAFQNTTNESTLTEYDYLII